MRLQSHDEFASVARFRPDDGDFVEMSRSDAGALLDRPLGGHFSRCLGRLAVLYRYGGVLRFRVGDLDYSLDQLSVEWSVDGKVARLSLESPDGRHAFEYAAAQSPEFDFTAGAEQEHFDFGLFVSNVAADVQRGARMYPGGTRT